MLSGFKMKGKKITLAEFFILGLKRFKERVENGEINDKKINEIGKLWAESSQLTDCDIFVDEGCINFERRK